jgi:hypothetical protein
MITVSFFYFGLCLIRHKIFNIPIPDKNLWNKPNLHLCTEISDKLPDWVFPRGKPKELSLTTPYKLYESMRP